MRPSWCHQLKGDLDWIVMKCLEKDRTRRYETANGLAFDLKRHLNNEPVLARPPSTALPVPEDGSPEQVGVRRGGGRHRRAGCSASSSALGRRCGPLTPNGDAIAARNQARSELKRKPSQQAKAKETQMREQAEAQELAARQRAYASDMNVAKQALDGNNLGRAQDLLEPPAAAARPKRPARLGMALSLAANPQRCLVHPLPEIQRDRFAGRLSTDGNWLAIGQCNGAVCRCGICGTRQRMFPLAKASFVSRRLFTHGTSAGIHQLSVPASGEERRIL